MSILGALGAVSSLGGIAEGATTAFSKLTEVLTSPINMMCNWAEEPIRRFEHDRLEKTKNADVQRDITRQVGVEVALSDQRIKEETEIEQLKKDKEFERMKKVSDSMMAYQTELTRINVEAVEAIGSMRIELQRKAYELIHEKTMQYNQLQDIALQQAQNQLERIDSNQNMSEASRTIMINAVDKKLAGIIDNATRFIVQLNDDMQLISKDINLITSSGQHFIQRHLEQFQLIGMSHDTKALLDGSDEKLISVDNSE